MAEQAGQRTGNPTTWVQFLSCTCYTTITSFISLSTPANSLPPAGILMKFLRRIDSEKLPYRYANMVVAKRHRDETAFENIWYNFFSCPP